MSVPIANKMKALFMRHICTYKIFDTFENHLNF